MNDKLTDFFASAIALFRQSHSANAIERAFTDAFEAACPTQKKPISFARSSALAATVPITEFPVVCTQSAADMRAVMTDFFEFYRHAMTEGEVIWFDRLLLIVNAGRKLAGKQVSTINSISERHSGMPIIM